MTKIKLNQIVFPLLVIALCFSLVAMPALSLSSPVNAASPSQATGAVSDINIISPVGAVPVTVTTGNSIDVSAKITVACTDCYTVAITIIDSAAASPVVIDINQQSISLFAGDTVVSRKVYIAPGAVEGAYDVIVTVDYEWDFDPATSPSDTAEGAVIVENTQEVSPVTHLISKSAPMVKELLDKSDTDEGAVNMESIREASHAIKLMGESASTVSALIDKAALMVEALVDKLDIEEGEDILGCMRVASLATNLIGKMAQMVGTIGLLLSLV